MTFKLPPRITEPLFLFAAGLMFGLAFWFGTRDAEFVNIAARAPGDVIEMRAERDARGQRVWRPIVRFTDPASGRAVIFDSHFRSRPAFFDAGDAVTVAYDPAEPDNARIDDFWTRYFFPLLAAILGAVFLFVIWITRKRGSRSGNRP